MSNKCEDFLNLIKDDLAGELSAAQQAALKIHLDECQNCSREQLELKKTVSSLSSFEEQPVPGHFFVYEQPRASIFKRFLNLPSGIRWASAAGLAAMVFFMGFILSNIRILQIGESRIVVAYGDINPTKTEEELRSEFLQILQQAREDDRRLFAGLLNDQQQQLNNSLRQQSRNIDSRLTGMEGQLLDTIDNNNTVLQNRLDRTVYQYSELLKTQQQGDLREVNRRLTQMTLEGRMRDRQTGALMATIAQLADSENRPTGGIDD